MMGIRLLIAAASESEYADWSEKIRQLGLPLEVLENADSRAALHSMAEIYLPEVILVNARLLAAKTEPQVPKRWKQFSRILLVTDSMDYPLAVQAFRSGVCDVLCLPQDMPRLEKDLQDILAQKTLAPSESAFLEQRRVVGKLLISYARRVHADRQLNEREVNSLYGTKFREGAFRFLTICFDCQSPSFSVDPEKYLSLAQVTAVNAVAEMCHDMFLNSDYLRYHILLNYDPANDGKILLLLQKSLEDVQAMLPEDSSLTFCCSQIHSSISDIIPLMDESGDAIWDRLQNQTGKLLIGTTPSPCPRELQQILDTAEQRLKGACAMLDLDQFRRELERLYRLPDGYKTRHEMRSVLRRTEHYMFLINRELIASFTNGERVRWDLILHLRRVNTVDGYLRAYTEQMTALFQRVLDHATGQQSRPVRQAQQFIRRNFASPLNLDRVAREVGLSPVYFSAVFKKEIGIGFADFLNQCRMEQAKKLLEDTGLKVAAVSRAAGFSSPRYFSRVFKNAAGLRPSEYRIAMQRKGDPLK